jgi:hypothetical protein
MDLHGKLNSQYSTALRSSCNKGGCTLVQNSLGSYRISIIDEDHYRNISGCQGKLCDLLTFITNPALFVVVAEMKTGNIRPKETALQIQNGAKESEKIVERPVVSKFVPVIVNGKIQHPNDLRVLQTCRIRFRGTNYPILRRESGEQLAGLIL